MQPLTGVNLHLFHSLITQNTSTWLITVRIHYKPYWLILEDLDLFGEETEEDKQIRENKEKQQKEAAQKPVGKITKSQLILDVKPLDDEVNLDELEQKIRALEFPTLVWGAANKEPIAYGLNALRIIATIHDDNQVRVDDVEDAIRDFEDHVSSLNIVAWNKL